MTKEEILKRINPNIDCWIDYSAILQAMEEYAAQFQPEKQHEMDIKAIQEHYQSQPASQPQPQQDEKRWCKKCNRLADYWCFEHHTDDLMTIQPQQGNGDDGFLSVLEENREACKKGAEKHHDNRLDKHIYEAVVREYDDLISIYKSKHKPQLQREGAEQQGNDAVVDRKFTLDERLDCWKHSSMVEANAAIMQKHQYFKEKFNIDL